MNAAAGNTQVALSWTAAVGAVSYDVYRSTTSGGEGSTPYQSGVTATSFTDTAVTNGTIYYYEVTGVNSLGQSGKSIEVAATPGTSPLVIAQVRPQAAPKAVRLRLPARPAAAMAP